MNRPLIALATGALAATMLTGCATATPPSGTTTGPGSPTTSQAPTTWSISGPLVTLVTPGTLTVCTTPPFKPMEFKDNSGVVVGFDLDIMQLVADKLGVTMTAIETDFAQITSGAVFAAKKCDIGASSITITDARKKALTFSAPYFSATQALAAPTASGIKSLADLKGKKVGVQTDTTGADYANAHAAENGYDVVVFEDGGTALNAILAGTVDATLIDLPVVADFVASNQGMGIATQFQTGELYGFAMGQDANSKVLAALVNLVLATADADGTYLKTYQKWIDSTATSVALPS